jgi:hypothetical protein
MVHSQAETIQRIAIAKAYLVWTPKIVKVQANFSRRKMIIVTICSALMTKKTHLREVMKKLRQRES